MNCTMYSSHIVHLHNFRSYTLESYFYLSLYPLHIFRVNCGHACLQLILTFNSKFHIGKKINDTVQVWRTKAKAYINLYKKRVTFNLISSQNENEDLSPIYTSTVRSSKHHCQGRASGFGLFTFTGATRDDRVHIVPKYQYGTLSFFSLLKSSETYMLKKSYHRLFLRGGWGSADRYLGQAHIAN